MASPMGWREVLICRPMSLRGGMALIRVPRQLFRQGI